MTDSSERKVVLVTGATGFIGANVARRLVSDGHYVHLLVRKKTNQLPWRITEINDRVKLDFYTPSEPDSIDRIFAEVKPKWVFHLAAHGAYSWQKDKVQILESNYILTSRLLEAAVEHGSESLINTGTSSEYGQKDHAPKEDEPLNPVSYYAATKAGATHLCRYIAGAHNINMPTLRLYSCFGPYEQPNRLITNLVACGLEGRWPALVNQDCAHDFVYVEDVVDAYILAAKRQLSQNCDPGAIYNVGTGVQTTLKEVVRIAAPLMNIEAKPTFGSMPNRSWDAEVWVCDHARITRELGWRPQHNFETGLKKMVDWYRQSSHLHSMYKDHLQLA
ncbi:MAG: NAD-dependent epimerase/dehydratase family protein [Candidatus Melainabacteria bacterium]|nr:NAD-dependent epimerase/dehydratase family protein [Candidatus Melainabacteria bacterium]